MLLGGDEMGRSQRGNNNAYCQDNEISWFNWEEADGDLLAFSRELIAFRQAHPVFRRRRWFKGVPHTPGAAADITWLKPSGDEMTEQDWNEWFAKSFMLFLNGAALRSSDRRGRPLHDDSLLLLFNSHTEPVSFTLPAIPGGDAWTLVLQTETGFMADQQPLPRGESLSRPGLSLAVFQQHA